MSSEFAEQLTKVIIRNFGMLFKTEPRHVKHSTESSQVAPFEVSGIIGISGQRKGCLVISFPREVANRLAVRMMGEPEETALPEDDLYDCVGEIANILAGNLLPLLDDFEQGSISLPSVVVGQHKIIWRRKDTPYDLLTYECDLGTFAAGINMRAATPENASVGKGYRFLLVDDSRVMRRMLQKALTESDIGECSFIEAGDGEKALMELERNEYAFDAVFCDICMPNMDGIAFLEELGERGKLKDLPVIIVTGDASDVQEKEALKRGAVSCIVKPFTAELMGSTLREALKLS